MKKHLLLSTLLLALVFTSCTKDQIDPIQDTPEKAEARTAINTVSNSFLSGSWHISSYMNNTLDLTSKYETYDFMFATNGTLTAKQDVGTGVIGKWTVSYVDGKTRVSFTFSDNSGFDTVSGAWTVIGGTTSSKMIMQRVVEPHDYITLEKN